MKKIYLFISLALFLNGCAIVKNTPQESKYMRVQGGGYFIKDRNEESYSISVKFKDLPSDAKYLIADFELPNNRGVYERKVLQIDAKDQSAGLNSDPVYGVTYGFYYVKLYLTKDKKGKNVIDSLEQSIKLYAGLSKGRDYANQYTLFGNGKEIKKLLVIYPNKRKNSLISAEVPAEFKLGYAAVGFDESMAEYVPSNETVYNWTKIITLSENKPINLNVNKPHIYAGALGDGMYKKFSATDKEMQITYAAIHNGKFINVETPNFRELIKSSNEVGVYVDYLDPSTIKKHPYQREYLSARVIKSDVSVWTLQCTVKYDKRWPIDKIESLKKESRSMVASLQYVNHNPIDNIEETAQESGVKDFRLESQRLDDRKLNEEFKEDQKKSDSIKNVKGKKAL